MYDTARRVALVKQRVRENTRRRQRREAISLSAACMLLCAALMQAADAFAVQGQTAAWGMFGAMLLREDAGGYVLVGVVSFAAAAAFTALCFRLRNRENQKKDGAGKPEPTRTGGEKPMKKRILSILLVCCMVLTMLPTAAFAAVSDSLGNTPEENQAILEQLSALTGGSSDQVLSMLNALGLLDEDGNFKVDQTITLDGQVLTLAAVMELLENPATDLTRIADVDGTPVALGDLKTMIQIEQELQRIKDTYFSGREFTGEALENLNSLMEQLELQGISLQYSASATEPEGVETVDMSGMMSQTLGNLANNTWSSGTFTVYSGKPVGFSYRIQKGQLSEYITGVEVSIGETSEVVEQSDGSYKLTYDVGSTFSLGGCKITVKVQTKGGNLSLAR